MKALGAALFSVTALFRHTDAVLPIRHFPRFLKRRIICWDAALIHGTLSFRFLQSSSKAVDFPRQTHRNGPSLYAPFKDKIALFDE